MTESDEGDSVAPCGGEYSIEIGHDRWIAHPTSIPRSDAFWMQGYKWALRTSQMLAEFDVAWFEEPLKPDALQDYIRLRQMAPVPIAGGEVLTRRQSF